MAGLPAGVAVSLAVVAVLAVAAYFITQWLLRQRQPKAAETRRIVSRHFLKGAALMGRATAAAGGGKRRPAAAAPLAAPAAVGGAAAAAGVEAASAAAGFAAAAAPAAAGAASAAAGAVSAGAVTGGRGVGGGGGGSPPADQEALSPPPPPSKEALRAAVAEFDAALLHDPDDFSTRYLRAQALEDLGEYDAALDELAWLLAERRPLRPGLVTRALVFLGVLREVELAPGGTRLVAGGGRGEVELLRFHALKRRGRILLLRKRRPAEALRDVREALVVLDRVAWREEVERRGQAARARARGMRRRVSPEDGEDGGGVGSGGSGGGGGGDVGGSDSSVGSCVAPAPVSGRPGAALQSSGKVQLREVGVTSAAASVSASEHVEGGLVSDMGASTPMGDCEQGLRGREEETEEVGESTPLVPKQSTAGEQAKSKGSTTSHVGAAADGSRGLPPQRNAGQLATAGAKATAVAVAGGATAAAKKLRQAAARSEILVLLGRCHESLGQRAEAERWLVQAVALGGERQAEADEALCKFRESGEGADGKDE